MRRSLRLVLHSSMQKVYLVRTSSLLTVSKVNGKEELAEQSPRRIAAGRKKRKHIKIEYDEEESEQTVEGENDVFRLV